MVALQGLTTSLKMILTLMNTSNNKSEHTDNVHKWVTIAILFTKHLNLITSFCRS